jgi:hypothetical protein
MKRILIFVLVLGATAFAQKSTPTTQYKLMKVRGILSVEFVPNWYTWDYVNLGQWFYVRIDVEHGTQCAITPQKSGMRLPNEQGPLGITVRPEYSEKDAEKDVMENDHGNPTRDYFVESCEVKR